MSQELMGTCGAAVGSSEYFHLLNQGKIFAPFMAQDGYQYSSAIGQLSSRCSAIIDEIYYDLQNIYGNIARLSPEHKDNLIKLITNLEVAASFMLPAYTSANSCIQLLSREESGEDESIMGIWGMDIGSYSYMQSKCSGIFSSAFADPLASISQAITADLTTIAEQIASDVETGISQNYYIKDENGDALQAAISELERCNCSILALSSSKVEKLCWFSNLSNADIVALQKALNKIPGFDKLTEDGIYGEKTSNIYDKLISSLIHGTFPSVAFINPLQSHSTGVWANAKITKAGESFTQLFMDGTSWPIFRADKHNYKGIPDFPHINVEVVRGAPDWQKAIVDMEKLNRREAGDYLFLIRREKSFLFSVVEVCAPGSYAYLSWTAYTVIPTVPVDAFYLHVTGSGGTLTGDVFLLDYEWAASEVERAAALRKGSREAHLLERLWRWREKCEESSVLAFTRAMKGCWQPDPGCSEAAPVCPEVLLMAERVRA